MAPAIHRRIVLARRPVGPAREDDFRIEERPTPRPGQGQMLVRNVFIPLDPGMRPAIGDRTAGVREFEPAKVGSLVGYLTVGQVEVSNVEGFAPGDWVTDYLRWQEYALSDGSTARKITETRLPPSTAVGILGVPGLSAYFGLRDLGAAKPGETVLVTSAAGAVGSAAGQIGKIIGCRVVGVAGGPEKCAWVRDELGFDAVIDHKATPDLAAAIEAACPDGVDVLFDNVGNAVIDAVLPLMRTHGRIVICGQTADYDTPVAERHGVRNTTHFVSRRLTMRGLFVHDFALRFDAAIAEMASWVLEGRLKHREVIERGFETLPAAFVRLFRGDTYGRLLVEVG